MGKDKRRGGERDRDRFRGFSVDSIGTSGGILEVLLFGVAMVGAAGGAGGIGG